MLDNFSGIKEMYDVNIRALKPLEIGTKKYDINEAILTFQTAELAKVNEYTSTSAAKGGYHNPDLINWTTDKNVNFAITHGVLSPKSWAILSNSKLVEKKNKSIPMTETIQATEDMTYCFVDLKYCPNSCERLGAQPNPDFEPIPMGRRPELLLKPLPPSKTKWIFCYDIDSGQRIRDFQIYRNRIFFATSVRKVLIDYTFNYEDKSMVLEVGNRLLNGFLRLDGKMIVKDQITGEITTALLELPKIKLSSALVVELGRDHQSSVVSDFFFEGVADENERRDQQKLAQISFLEKELGEEYI